MSLMFLPVHHGVTNALLSARWTDFGDCFVYCTHYPCDKCKNIITQCGIKDVRFVNERKCDGKETGQEECIENCVKIVKWDGKLADQELNESCDIV